LNFSVVGFEEQAAIVLHVDDAACFFDGAFSSVAVLVGAVVIHDDSASGADELIHAFPGFDPWTDAEGAELPDGALKISDERLQKFFAIDGVPENGFERCDFAI